MSSAASDPQNNARQVTSNADESSMARAADSGLLERVLKQTLEICEIGEPVTRDEMQAFRDVAARHRGQPLELEPVAVELVAAAIGGLCPARNNSEFWRNLTVQVARILMDDPSTFARLNSFWIRLGGGEM
jgi:hypothetical protein